MIEFIERLFALYFYVMVFLIVVIGPLCVLEALGLMDWLPGGKKPE